MSRVFRFLRQMTVVCVALLGALASAMAQDVRDPTIAPAEASVIPGVPGSASSTPGMAVVVQDGKPHLVVGTRLVAVGQKVGPARLERITETEIWLREGKQIRKVPRFSGIERSVAKPLVPCKAPRAKPPVRSKSPTAPPKPPATPAVPCEGVQP